MRDGSAGGNLYTDNFAYEPAGFKERTAAMAIGALLLALVACIVPFARERAPVIGGFVPAVESAAVVTFLLTATMLSAQYRVRSYAPLAILAVGFGMQAALHAVYAWAFPGAGGSERAVHELQSAPWLYVAARLAFALTIAVYVFAEWRQQRGDPVGPAFVAGTSAAASAYVAGACALAFGALNLPPIVLSSGDFSPPYVSFGLPVLLAAQLGSGLALILVCSLRRRVHLWLTLAILGGMLDAFGSGFLAGGRFTYGWYIARIEMCANAIVFLAILQVQLAAILRRAARSGERAHVLYEIVALGSDGTAAGIDPMLARAARDLDFDWAFLVRLEAGCVVVESDISGGPFTAGFRTPLAATLLRHTIASDDLFAVDDIARSKWADDPSGAAKVWASFVSVPVHTDGVPYGAVGFASAKRREKPLNDADLAFVRLVGILAGSTIERARQRRHLDGLAFFDSLTGLANRSLLLQRLDQTLRSAALEKTGFALQFIDLDDFKSINDSYGHAAGDAALLELGRRLAAAVRTGDTVARLGGDEFVVLLPGVNAEGSREVEARLQAVFDEPFLVDGVPRPLSGSCGMSFFPADGTSAQDLLAAADRELYRAKAARSGGAGGRPPGSLQISQ